MPQLCSQKGSGTVTLPPIAVARQRTTTLHDDTDCSAIAQTTLARKLRTTSLHGQGTVQTRSPVSDNGV